MATLFLYDETIHGFTSAPAPDCGEAVMWSDARFTAACRELCSRFEVAMGRSFSRVGMGGFAPFSAHYAGLAADFALLSPGPRVTARLSDIRRYCISSGLFSYVQPQYLTPLWVHAEVSVAPPCSLSVPYPVLRPGDTGVHVCVLQDCLNACGFPCLICGRFGEGTLSALSKFAKKACLPTYDIVTVECWQALFYLIKKAPHQLRRRSAQSPMPIPSVPAL